MSVTRCAGSCELCTYGLCNNTPLSRGHCDNADIIANSLARRSLTWLVTALAADLAADPQQTLG